MNFRFSLPISGVPFPDCMRIACAVTVLVLGLHAGAGEVGRTYYDRNPASFSLDVTLPGFLPGRTRPIFSADLAQPPGWDEYWPTTPLFKSQFYRSYPVPAVADTYISQADRGASNGSETFGVVGNGQTFAGLVKFDLNAIPKEGTLPIAQVHLALAFEGTSNFGIILGVKGACQPWEEATASWNNAGCDITSAGVTKSLSLEPDWLLIDVTHPVGLSENGYFFFGTNGPLSGTRRFLTKEAGPQFAPRLIISYVADNSPPTLDGSVGYQPAFSSASYLTPRAKIWLTVMDDAGLGRLLFELETESGEKRGATVEMENGCKINLGRYQYNDYPFPDLEPLGQPLTVRAWAEDCTGKRTGPVERSHVYNVMRLENVNVYDFVKEPVHYQALKRYGDLAYHALPAGLPPAPFQNTLFGSISGEARYWVKAQGFPEDSKNMIRIPLNTDGNSERSDLYIPWHESHVLQTGGNVVGMGNSLRVPVEIPQEAERSIVATIVTVQSDNVGDTVRRIQVWLETQEGKVNVGVGDAALGFPNLLSVDLTNWRGQTGTLIFEPVPDNGGEWTFQIGDIVMSAQNPELSVTDQVIVTTREGAAQGIPIGLPYTVAASRSTVSTTIGLTVSQSVSLTDFVPVPTRTITSGDSLYHEWTFPFLTQPGGVISATLQATTPTVFTMEIDVVNRRDPVPANNRAVVTVLVADSQIYLPVVGRSEFPGKREFSQDRYTGMNLRVRPPGANTEVHPYHPLPR